MVPPAGVRSVVEEERLVSRGPPPSQSLFRTYINDNRGVLQAVAHLVRLPSLSLDTNVVHVAVEDLMIDER